MSTLIIFDIDGTLTQTNEVDSICFAQAISEQLNIDELNTQWDEYQYSTDSGLLLEIVNTHLKREPLEKETQLIQNRFVDLLAFEFKTNNRCMSVPGGSDIIHSIHVSEKYHAAIATGGWRVSANLKLEHAGIPHQQLPKAYSDWHLNRTDIILHSIELAKKQYQTSFESMIYIGDRLWDYRAAKQLGIGFIGVGCEFKNMNNIDVRWVQDYLDVSNFFELIHKVC